MMPEVPSGRRRSKSIGETRTPKTSKNYATKMDSKLKKIYPLNDKQLFYVSAEHNASEAWKVCLTFSRVVV
jgi:hypothetical protein